MNINGSDLALGQDAQQNSDNAQADYDGSLNGYLARGQSFTDWAKDTAAKPGLAGMVGPVTMSNAVRDMVEEIQTGNHPDPQFSADQRSKADDVNWRPVPQQDWLRESPNENVFNIRLQRLQGYDQGRELLSHSTTAKVAAGADMLAEFYLESRAGSMAASSIPGLGIKSRVLAGGLGEVAATEFQNYTQRLADHDNYGAGMVGFDALALLGGGMSALKNGEKISDLIDAFRKGQRTTNPEVQAAKDSLVASDPRLAGAAVGPAELAAHRALIEQTDSDLQNAVNAQVQAEELHHAAVNHVSDLENAGVPLPGPKADAADVARKTVALQAARERAAEAAQHLEESRAVVQDTRSQLDAHVKTEMDMHVRHVLGDEAGLPGFQVTKHIPQETQKSVGQGLRSALSSNGVRIPVRIASVAALAGAATNADASNGVSGSGAEAAIEALAGAAGLVLTHGRGAEAAVGAERAAGAAAKAEKAVTAAKEGAAAERAAKPSSLADELGEEMDTPAALTGTEQMARMATPEEAAQAIKDADVGKLREGMDGLAKDHMVPDPKGVVIMNNQQPAFTRFALGDSLNALAKKLRMPLPDKVREALNVVNFKLAPSMHSRLSLSRSQTMRDVNDVLNNSSRGEQILNADALAANKFGMYSGKAATLDYNAFNDWRKETLGEDPSKWDTARPSIVGQFRAEASKAMRGNAEVTSPTLLQYAKDLQAQRDEVIAWAKQAHEQSMGGRTLAKDSMLKKLLSVENTDEYMRRIWDPVAVQRAMELHGPEAVIQRIAEAHMEAKEGVSAEAAQVKAETLLQNVMAHNPGNAKFHPLISLSEATPGQFLERIALNEKQAPKMVKTLDGGERPFAVSDLWLNDPLKAQNAWLRSTVGITSLATAGAQLGVDLTSVSEFNMLVAKMLHEGATTKELKLLTDARSALMGAPNDTFQGAHPAWKTLDNMLDLVSGKYFAFGTSPDAMAQIPSAMIHGWKNALPSTAELVNRLRNNEPIGELARQLANATGFGFHHSPQLMKRAIEEGWFGKLDTMIDYAGHKAMLANGMPAVLDIGGTIGQNVYRAKLAEVAHGLADYNQNTQRYLAAMGMDAKKMEAMKDLIKRHSEFDAQGLLTKFDGDAMRKEHLLHGLTIDTALYKAMKDSMSEPIGIGQSIPELQNDLGRLLQKYMSSGFASHQRLLRTQQIGWTPEMVAKFVASSMAGSTAYAARTMLQYGGNQKELDKRLSVHAAMWAGLKYSSMAGLLPDMYGKFAALTGAPNPWETASASRDVQGVPPALDFLFNRLGRTVKEGIGIATDPNKLLTADKANRALGMVMPLWYLDAPMRMFNYQMLPEHDPKQPKQSKD